MTARWARSSSTAARPTGTWTPLQGTPGYWRRSPFSTASVIDAMRHAVTRSGYGTPSSILGAMVDRIANNKIIFGRCPMSGPDDPFSFDAEFGDPDYVKSARDPNLPPQTGKEWVDCRASDIPVTEGGERKPVRGSR